jgi:hypothetical protein
MKVLSPVDKVNEVEELIKAGADVKSGKFFSKGHLWLDHNAVNIPFRYILRHFLILKEHRIPFADYR